MKIKKGDTRNAIRATLKRNGQAVNLTDCHVRFLMSNGVQGHAIVDRPLSGKCYYNIEKSISEKEGLFNFEFEVEYPDGRVETFPNDGYLRLKIVKDLGGIA